MCTMLLYIILRIHDLCLYEQQDLFEDRNVTHKAGQEQERYTTTDDEEGFGSSSPVWSRCQVRGFGFVG